MQRRAYSVVALACLLVAGASSFEAPQAPPRTVITKHFTPNDQVTGRYQYVPFDVPQGAGTLRVSYTYDRANGENVVDLGLFEPGPLDLGTRAFRGYSGGARSEVTIDAASATPGYVPGPLPPGKWHVLLGLYRVRSSGVDVRVTIETAAESPSPRVELLIDQPAERDSAWHLGALHTHTLHSDGTLSPAEVMQQFRDKAFDFVAITDHNNTTHAMDTRLGQQSSPMWIIGEEVTTPGGHASVWGLPYRGWVDFRVLPGDPRIRDLVAAAREQGAMFSINHPASECLACGWTHEVVEGIEGIEISNGRHGEVEKAVALWDKLLMSGRRITGVGSSDWHSAPNPVDNAHVRVYAPALTPKHILSAIREGHVIVMTDARDATPEVSVRVGEVTAGIGDTLPLESVPRIDVQVDASSAPGGRLSIVANGQRALPMALDAKGRARAEIPGSPGYVRFEIMRADGTAMAYTNPVYLVR